MIGSVFTAGMIFWAMSGRSTEHLCVRGIWPNSPISKTNTQPGDCIANAGGVAWPSRAEFDRQEDRGLQMTIVIRHPNGKEEKVNITPIESPSDLRDQRAVCRFLAQNAPAIRLVDNAKGVFRDVPLQAADRKLGDLRVRLGVDLKANIRFSSWRGCEGSSESCNESQWMRS